MTEGNGQQNGQPTWEQRKFTALDRQRRALELRRAGKDYRTIAAEIGYANPGNAFKAVAQALKALVREPARHVLQLEVGRLDALLDRLWPHVDCETPDLKAVDRVVKVMERRAALLGLDAPKGLLVGDITDRRWKVYAGFNPEDV